MEMFVIVEWPNAGPPKLGSDLTYDTRDEAVDAAEFILDHPVGPYSELPRLTVHPVGGVGNNGDGATWDSEAIDWPAGIPR